VDGLNFLVDTGLGGADHGGYCEFGIRGELSMLRAGLRNGRSADPVEWALESMDCVVRSIAVSRAREEV